MDGTRAGSRGSAAGLRVGDTLKVIDPARIWSTLTRCEIGSTNSDRHGGVVEVQDKFAIVTFKVPAKPKSIVRK